VHKNYRYLLWSYAIVLIALTYSAGLFIDLTGDSGLYAAISREMAKSGDWLNLTINGEPYDQKPHLFFWLAGLGVKLFGNTNVAFKLFPFLFGLGSIYFIFRLAKMLTNRNAGILAVIIAGSSQIFFLYFLDLHTDTVLQAGVSLALWQLAVHLNRKNILSFILGFAGIGLAMLTKGPIGAVIPFFFVVLYLLLNKEFSQLINPKWLAGILIVLLIISPTLHHLYKSFGWEGLRFYFIDNNIGRITGQVAGSNSDPLFYIYNLIWAFLPWTVFLVIAIFLEIRSWTDRRSRDAMRAAILGSVLIILIILSIAKGKAPNYMMVMTAPLSVVIAGWSDYWLKLPGEKIRKLIMAQALLLTAIFLFLLFTVFFFAENVHWLAILLIIVSGVVLYAVYRINDNSAVRIILASLIVTGTFNLFLNSVIIPQLYSYQGCRKVLSVFEENRDSGDRLYNFEVEQYELFFYAEDKVTDIDNWEDLYKTLGKPGSWIYTNKTKYNDVLNMNYPIDTVYEIRQRGMNRITLEFLNPKSREESLITNYLIKTGE